MDFVSQPRSKRETAKTIKRGAAAPIKRVVAEDTQKREFDSAFDTLARGRITDASIQNRLKNYRDQIPFVAARDSQPYLAAALISWYLLGEPTSDDLNAIDPDQYHSIVDPVFSDLLDYSASRKKQAELVTSSVSRKTTDSSDPAFTLFRHISLVPAALENI